MFGHWVGSCAEVAIKINVCSHMPIKYKDLCNGSTVFIHELLVEPLFNALFFKLVANLISHKVLDEPANSLVNPWLSLFAGAVTSLYLSKVTEIIPTDFKPEILHNNEVWVEALASLPGNYIGEASYEALAKTNPIVATSMFGCLLSYKVYSNLYLSEAALPANETNTHCYVFPWDEFCRAPDEHMNIRDHIC